MKIFNTICATVALIASISQHLSGNIDRGILWMVVCYLLIIRIDIADAKKNS